MGFRSCREVKLKEIYIKNYRSFDEEHITELSPSINVLIGKNNSGKSNILKSIAVLQYPVLINSVDIRTRKNEIALAYKFDYYNFKKVRIKNKYFESQQDLDTFKINSFNFSLNRKDSTQLNVFSYEPGGNRTGIVNTTLETFSQSEPQNLLYYFRSNRKVPEISQNINKRDVNILSNNFLFLHARIDSILAENSQRGIDLITSVNEILGFKISSIPSDGGKLSCILIDEENFISIDKMGEGVLNILYLLTLLFSTKGSIFLIEELENDLHPEALKKLLNIIIDKSKDNQFFISTHSHIVLKQLGTTLNSNLYSIDLEYSNLIPTSKLRLITKDVIDRRQVLESLGYNLTDFDFAKYWIIFEESSAERIFNDYLIPWFVPKFRYGLKTISSNGAQQLINKTSSINDLFLFLHLESNYKDRVWVIADGDREGIKAIQNLKAKYNSWDENHFINLGEDAFELYYPSVFQDEVKKILNTKDKQSRRTAKRELLSKLIEWIDSDDEKAKIEFKKSASDIISILEKIEASVAK